MRKGEKEIEERRIISFYSFVELFVVVAVNANQPKTPTKIVPFLYNLSSEILASRMHFIPLKLIVSRNVLLFLLLLLLF